jgi:predicted nucleotidyltransferase
LGTGALQREVRNLTEAGIIKRLVRGRQIYYQANSQCPVFTELRSLIIKTAGVGDVLRAALAPLADRITISFIYGSVARMDEQRGSDIDVMVVGDVSFAEVVSVFDQAQKLIAREINPNVYPVSEFRSKLATDNHFLKITVSGAKLFIIGDTRELERLAKKRLAN